MPSLIKEKRKNRHTDSKVEYAPLQWTLNEILTRVCKHLGVSKNDVSSGSRGAKLVKARAIFGYICRERGFSTLAIGKAINRNHSTVTIHHLRFKEYLDETKPWYNPDLALEIAKIVKFID